MNNISVHGGEGINIDSNESSIKNKINNICNNELNVLDKLISDGVNNATELRNDVNEN